MRPSDYVSIKNCTSILHPKGNIIKLLNVHDNDFTGFGEAYLTKINSNETKGWKRHQRMHSVLHVMLGIVEFKFKIDLADNEEHTVILSDQLPQKLHVKPGVWMAFTGRNLSTSVIINIADIAHDPTEALTADYAV